MDLILRKALKEDVSAISCGLSKAFIHLLESLYDNGYYPYFSNARWIEDKIDNEYVYVCQSGREIIGGIIICKNPDKMHLKLHTVYVDEELRNKGIGFFIIKSAEALHKNALEWRLETLINLDGNRHLYEKLGYTLYGLPKVVNEKVTIVYYMKLYLT